MESMMQESSAAIKNIKLDITNACKYNEAHVQGLRNVCKPIIKLGFDTFFYTKISTEHSTAFSLCTNLEWFEYCWKENLLYSPRFIEAFKRSLVNKSYVLLIPNIAEASYYKVYNLISNCDCMAVAKQNHIVEYWGFGSSQPTPNIMNLYINNSSAFRRFFSYFKYEHKTIIAEGEKSSFIPLPSLPIQPVTNSNNLEEDCLKDICPKHFYLMHEGVELLLSYKQLQCLFYMSRGLSIKEIAVFLNLSPRTVEFHINKIKRSLHCNYKSELMDIACKNFVDKLWP